MQKNTKLTLIIVCIIAIASIAVNGHYFLQQRDRNRLFSELLFMSFISAHSHLGTAVSVADGSCINRPLDIEEAFIQLNLASIQLRRAGTVASSLNAEFHSRYSRTLGDFNFLADILSVPCQVADFGGYSIHGIQSDGQISDSELLFLSRLTIAVGDIVNEFTTSQNPYAVIQPIRRLSPNEIVNVLDDFLVVWGGLVGHGFYGGADDNPFTLLDRRHPY